MLCYKDKTWCTAVDCVNTKCGRNTKDEYFQPDEFWRTKIAYSSYQASCKEYTKITDIVAGIVPFTLIDYPGEIAAVLFTKGCNLRCRYCHNPSLVAEGEDYTSNIAYRDVISFLDEHKGKLTGIVISGGEPLLTASKHPEDFKFLVKDIKNRDYKVKLDTNATLWTECKLSPVDLFDSFAFDLKGFGGGCDAVHEALEDVIKSGKPYELRTTVHKSLITEDDLLRLKSEFIDKHNISPDSWYLQQFHSGDLLDNTINKEDTYSDKELQSIAVRLGCKTRGIQED